MHMCFDEAGEEGMASSIDGSSSLLTLDRDCNAYSGDLAILHNDVGGRVNILSVEEADVLEDCGHLGLYSRQSRRLESASISFNQLNFTVASKEKPGTRFSQLSVCVDLPMTMRV